MFLKRGFGFGEHQANFTHVLGKNLSTKRKIDSKVIKCAAGTNGGILYLVSYLHFSSIHFLNIILVRSTLNSEKNSTKIIVLRNHLSGSHCSEMNLNIRFCNKTKK